MKLFSIKNVVEEVSQTTSLSKCNEEGGYTGIDCGSGMYF
jgi:hypothetical protein